MTFVKWQILFIFILVMFSVFPVFAQEDNVPFISVKTDDSHYDEGDTIVISGQVKVVIPDTPIILQVWFEGNMIEIAQFFPAKDGSFSHTILAEKPTWKKEGEYLIRVSHGEGNISETSITYSPKKESIEVKDSFEVQIPNGGTFDAEYSILGGTLKNIILEPENFTLRITIDSPDEGSISIKLPRESIDATKQNGEDEKFIVLVDNVQVPYKEAETNSETRLITINYDHANPEIQIIGTHVIPEFGPMVLLILILGISTLILFSRTKMQSTIQFAN